MLLAARPCLVEVSRANNAAVSVCDATEAYPEGIESQPLAVAAVVQPIMMMAVERLGHAEAAAQLVDGVEAVRVAAVTFFRTVG